MTDSINDLKTDVIPEKKEEVKEIVNTLSITQKIGVDNNERLDFSIPLDFRITDHLLAELRFFIEDMRKFKKIQEMEKEKLTKKIIMPGNNPIKNKFNKVFHKGGN